MKFIKQFSEEKFKIWYMDREYRKKGNLVTRDNNQLLDEFERDHSSGKGLSDFYPQRWDIVVITQEEFENLIHLESRWTIQTGLTITEESRRLMAVAQRAEETNYWMNLHPKHLEYYEQIKAGSLRLESVNRIVIRNATMSEKMHDHDALFYLHDGNSRGLAYMRALLKGEVEFHPVQAIYVDTTRL